MSSSTAKMMDFDNILDIASQNQGLSSVQKRYSLQTGPPKKDPKSKGVNPAAVQALLKKRQNDSKQKEIENKKQKEQLLAKRVELKSDRKARAMASRTKDNFKGYNGIPVVETPKKRGSKGDKRQDHPNDSESFRNNAIDPLDDEDNYEYGQTDSEGEPEPEPEMMRPQKPMGVSGPSKSVSKKVSGPPKPPPPAMNFADLLRLAEKKQFEPVELKPKVKKEERLRTAEEIRELEMERKAKRPDKSRDSKVDGGREGRSLSTSSSVRKNTTEKEQKHNKLQRNSTEKSSLPSRSGNKVHSAGTSDKGLSFSKQSDKERNREKTPHSDRERSKMGISASSVAALSKNPSKAPSSQVSTKHVSSRTALTQKPSSSSDLSSRKDSFSLHQKGASGIQGNKHSSGGGAGQRSQHATSQQTRPLQGSSLKQGSIAGEMKSNRGDSNGNSLRPSLGGPSKAGKQCQGRPMGIPLNKPGGGPQTRPGGTSPERGGSRPPGPFRPGSGGQVPGRPNSNLESGPGRPKCTVVSETISSKNVGGPRPGVSPRPGMQQRPGMTPGMRPGMTPGMRPGMTPGMRPGMTPGMRPGMTPGMRPGMTPGMRPGIPPRPMMNRPPGTMLPPITIAYKRKYEEEEEEYDPEMDDFIDDGGEEQDEISRHIKEIFGYDRNRYKDESDYALKFMESSWKDLQKEEARSLRMAVQEDLEEERREEEELKRKKAKRKKVN